MVRQKGPRRVTRLAATLIQEFCDESKSRLRRLKARKSMVKNGRYSVRYRDPGPKDRLFWKMISARKMSLYRARVAQWTIACA